MVSEINPSLSTTRTAFRASSTDAGVALQHRQPTERALGRAQNWAGFHGWPVHRSCSGGKHRRTEMNARTDSQQPASAAPRRQVSVLLRQAIEHLAPHAGGVYIYGTFGAGGYAAAILDTADAQVIGIDRDAKAIAGGRAMAETSGGRLTLVEGRFAALDRI